MAATEVTSWGKTHSAADTPKCQNLKTFPGKHLLYSCEKWTLVKVRRSRYDTKLPIHIRVVGKTTRADGTCCTQLYQLTIATINALLNTSQNTNFLDLHNAFHLSLSLSLSLYIYIYIYIRRCKETFVC
jgi:hypothetical protein